MTDNALKVRVPAFPTYTEVRTLLPILDGVAKSAVLDMLNAIFEQTGTPQDPVDWTDPNAWIDERLTGAEADLAHRIWEESKSTVNPRHMRGSYWLINRYELLVPDTAGVYQRTDRGKAFAANDVAIVREIDEAEGLLQLLTILATKTRARSADLLPEWGDFLREYSNFGTTSTIKDTLRRRLLNLVERGLVAREGQALYVITPDGINYAAPGTRARNDPKRDVLQAIAAFNDSQRRALRERLGQMHPYRFEHLVRELLEAMGYDDVQVTRASGDRGVDVVATVQFGITTITEVVQVKRHQASIGRPVLDQLRGALPYHKAIRGTIITLGTFSSGCKDAALYPGAAPIGLIDGNRLLDLLYEHKIGLKERPATLYELDEEFFTRPDPVEHVGDALEGMDGEPSS
ncbi:MAG: restriction endonuclease [Chloroflexota bacterium]|nr:restriction endonuclease [Chloroflexota bacterium]